MLLVLTGLLQPLSSLAAAQDYPLPTDVATLDGIIDLLLSRWKRPTDGPIDVDADVIDVEVVPEPDGRK